MLCGVVEGFYNRPWSQAQRLDLFKKLKSTGNLNCYLYAPKDDHKHRALWREPYTESEIAELKILIDSCSENGIRFYYGISPGLDMTYSSKNDLSRLKHKMDQLSALGCKGFALLWDDIDTSLPLLDQPHFEHLGEAHVRITNEIYRHLKKPDFLVCPVEYCASRAEPNVRESVYLNALGSGLDPEIGIFWTGSKVVPEVITQAEILKVGNVIKRKPVLWDNIHANDYDTQRIFMGPYSGRDPGKLIPHIRGVLTNPNCEYSANVPALVTLSEWIRAKNKIWDPIKASEMSIQPFLEELNRPTDVGVHCQNFKQFIPEREAESLKITPSDVRLLIHFFWLPYSHGPQGDYLLSEFEFLRDHAHIIKELEEDEDDINGSYESEFASNWIQRASYFNEVCMKFTRLCDKLSFIDNRQLFFDLNPYLNNMQVMLSACNRYLKWVGLTQCKKPISGGPTLSGLPGGLVGDFQRLYPIQSMNEYPVTNAYAYHEKRTLIVKPVLKSDSAAAFVKLYCQVQQIESLSLDLQDLIYDFKIKSVIDNDDDDEFFRIGFILELDEEPIGLLYATKNVRGVLNKWRSLKPSRILDIGDAEFVSVPTSLIEEWDSLISVTVTTELLFTKTLEMTLDIIFENLKDRKCVNTLICLNRQSSLSLQFLRNLNFWSVFKTEHYNFLKRNI